LTFADAAEKGGDGDSGHSQVAIIDLGMVPAERRHPKAAYSRSRTHVDIGRRRKRSLEAAYRCVARGRQPDFGMPCSDSARRVGTLPGLMQISFAGH